MATPLVSQTVNFNNGNLATIELPSETSDRLSIKLGRKGVTETKDFSISATRSIGLEVLFTYHNWEEISLYENRHLKHQHTGKDFLSEVPVAMMVNVKSIKRRLMFTPDESKEFDQEVKDKGLKPALLDAIEGKYYELLGSEPKQPTGVQQWVRLDPN